VVLAVDFVQGILPILVFLVGLGSLMIAVPSFYRDRQNKKASDEDRDVLYGEAIAHVMGRAANPARGQPEVVGLIQTVPEIQKQVEHLADEIGAGDPDAPLVALIADIRRDVAKLAREVREQEDRP